MHQFGTSGSTSKFVARATFFVIGAIAISLWTVISVFMAATQRVNVMAAARENALLVSALDNELGSLKRQITMVADGAADNEEPTDKFDDSDLNAEFANHTWSYFGFSSGYIVDATGRVIIGTEKGKASDQAAFDALRPHVEDMLRGTVAQVARRGSLGESPLAVAQPAGGLARLMHDGDHAFAAVVVPLQRHIPNKAQQLASPFMAVAIKPITDAELINIARRQGLGSFTISTRASSVQDDEIALKNGAGHTMAFLRWTPERPGDGMFRDFSMTLIVALLFIAAISVWIFANLRSVAREIAYREEMIGRIAAYDELSGLYNRRSFDTQLDQELARIQRSGSGLAVHFIDLDKFKPVNDIYGHKVGDELIKLVGQRLKSLVRGPDSVARLGGDEFAIVQTEVGGEREAAVLGQRILDALTEPFLIGDIEVTVGASIGIALAPADGKERELLIRLADTALYQSKNEGRNRYSFFERQMDRSVQIGRIVADDLRNAIENDELILHYQPQLSADGHKLTGVEALVRWQHPVHGMIPPGDFIATAEQRGLIVPLSQWVLRRACLDAARWPSLKMAVNVSPIDFRNRDFVGNVTAILNETGFDATRLELELTEGVVVEDADAAEHAMMELRALGIGLALDDFGTGYSSLIYLRRFAFDNIKIDRSFLEYMETTGESAILVHSVVHLGRALGLRVCAEGVETAEQHRFLQAVGCHELQGFYFSRPVPAHEIDALLEKEAAKDVNAAAA